MKKDRGGGDITFPLLNLSTIAYYLPSLLKKKKKSNIFFTFIYPQ